MKYTFLIFTIFYCFALPMIGNSAIMRIDWSGVVDSLFEFQAGDAPEGVTIGTRVTGYTLYDNSESSHTTSNILGNISSGNRHFFETSLFQSISIGANTWTSDGGIITLSRSFTTNRQSFGLLTNSNDYVIDSTFPSYGYDEISYFLFNSMLPINLYDSSILSDATIVFSDLVEGAGRISSRRRDDSGSFVGGYVIEFQAESATLNSIPEPSAFLLLLLGSVLAIFSRRVS